MNHPENLTGAINALRKLPDNATGEDIHNALCDAARENSVNIDTSKAQPIKLEYWQQLNMAIFDDKNGPRVGHHIKQIGVRTAVAKLTTSIARTTSSI